VSINYVDRSQHANHYTMPPHVCCISRHLQCVVMWAGSSTYVVWECSVHVCCISRRLRCVVGSWTHLTSGGTGYLLRSCQHFSLQYWSSWTSRSRLSLSTARKINCGLVVSVVICHCAGISHLDKWHQLCIIFGLKNPQFRGFGVCHGFAIFLHTKVIGLLVMLRHTEFLF